MRKWCLVCLVFAGLLGLPSRAAQQTEAQKPAERLRARAEGFYTAWVEGRWKILESYLNEDAKVLWSQSKKSAILSFELKSAEVLPGRKEGLTDAVVEFVVEMPGFAGRSLKIPQKQEWVWENSDWYVVWKLRPPLEIKPVLKSQPPEKPKGDPELEFDPEVYDFRLLPKGEPIRAKFSFTNKSDHKVKLRATSYNPCKCFDIKVSKTEVAPGEGGTIEFTMDSSPFGGYFAQGIVVDMEPSGAQAVLTVEGTILLPGQKPGLVPKQNPK